MSKEMTTDEMADELLTLYRENSPEKVLERWKEQEPERKRLWKLKKDFAHKVAKQIPMASCCELCDLTEQLSRHHPDYDYPYIFVTLCWACHGCQSGNAEGYPI